MGEGVAPTLGTGAGAGSSSPGRTRRAGPPKPPRRRRLPAFLVLDVGAGVLNDAAGLEGVTIAVAVRAAGEGANGGSAAAVAACRLPPTLFVRIMTVSSSASAASDIGTGAGAVAVAGTAAGAGAAGGLAAVAPLAARGLTNTVSSLSFGVKRAGAAAGSGARRARLERRPLAGRMVMVSSPSMSIGDGCGSGSGALATAATREGVAATFAGVGASGGPSTVALASTEGSMAPPLWSCARASSIASAGAAPLSLPLRRMPSALPVLPAKLSSSAQATYSSANSSPTCCALRHRKVSRASSSDSTICCSAYPTHRRR